MKYIFRLLIGFLLTLVLLEVGLRIAGFLPFHPPKYGVKSNPDNWVSFKQNKGFVLNPGTYRIVLGKFNFKTTHSADSNRATKDSLFNFSLKKPIVQLHGCSFTYGFGVSNENTFAWKLQEQYPLIDVQNKGVPGYGQVQLLYDLNDSNDKFENVHTIVLNYLNFHDERNALNLNYQDKLNLGYQLSNKTEPEYIVDPSFPYVSMRNNRFYLSKLNLSEFEHTYFWEKQSSLVHLIGKYYKNVKIDVRKDFEVSKYVIQSIQNACKKKGIELVVSFMDQKDGSKKMKAFCKENAIQTIDISIDWEDTTMTNYPFDLHPSPKAHFLLAQKLNAVLEKIPQQTMSSN